MAEQVSPGVGRIRQNDIYVNGIRRRCIWTADILGDEWVNVRSALIPGEFEDICAISRGFVSGDFYSMGMLPAAGGTIGFVEQFRHQLPRTPNTNFGIFGAVDVTLAYQHDPNDRWLHSPGRQDFLSPGVLPWASGRIHVSSGSRPCGLARASPYTNCRAEGTRMSAALNV